MPEGGRTTSSNLGQAAHIRMQRLRQLDASIGPLAVLEDGDDDAREGEAAAVESMDVFDLAVLVAKAAFHAPRLEVGEVAAAADLEPAVDAGGPRLEVVGLRAG